MLNIGRSQLKCFVLSMFTNASLNAPVIQENSILFVCRANLLSSLEKVMHLLMCWGFLKCFQSFRDNQIRQNLIFFLAMWTCMGAFRQPSSVCSLSYSICATPMYLGTEHVTAIVCTIFPQKTDSHTRRPLPSCTKARRQNWADSNKTTNSHCNEISNVTYVDTHTQASTLSLRCISVSLGNGNRFYAWAQQIIMQMYDRAGWQEQTQYGDSPSFCFN